jgi:branched-chain amino acid transport system ATP-binding protein
VKQLLLLEKISASYNSLPVLHNIDLELYAGEFLSIIGANGMGKSTLLKTIIGAVKAVTGKIFFKGEDITNLSIHERVKKGISLVPEGRRIFPDLTVEENLKAAASYTKDNKVIGVAYEYFPVLKNKRNVLAGNLSGGEQQMLAIGRALIQKPSLLMMDEPSLGLSPAMVKNLYKNIYEIKRNNPTLSIVLVEQNAEYATLYADSVCVMESGKISEKMSLSELKESAFKKYFGFSD